MKSKEKIDQYLPIFANFYSRSYILDFINKKDNKIKETLIASDKKTNILDDIQNYTYAEFFNYIYEIIKLDYRCEYFYLNEIFLNEILKNHDDNHSVITELAVNKSQADLVIVNGTTTIYEIKTELDSLTRLPNQLDDYIKVFDKVYVVTYKQLVGKVNNLLNSEKRYSKVGIYILNDECKLQLIKSSGSHLRLFDKNLMFDILTRKEFENLNENYDQAKKKFCGLSTKKSHEYLRLALFQRGKNIKYIENLPDSLKLAGYKIQNKLNNRQKLKFYTKLNYKIKEDL